MPEGTNFAHWATLAQKELRDTPLSSLDRDYGGIAVKPVYLGDDGAIPGVEPFTRGVRATMYANRPWTIRQYAGFSTARESNAFYRQALEKGQKASRSPSTWPPIAVMTATTRALSAMSARPASPSTASRT